MLLPRQRVTARGPGDRAVGPPGPAPSLNFESDPELGVPGLVGPGRRRCLVWAADRHGTLTVAALALAAPFISGPRPRPGGRRRDSDASCPAQDGVVDRGGVRHGVPGARAPAIRLRTDSDRHPGRPTGRVRGPSRAGGRGQGSACLESIPVLAARTSASEYSDRVRVHQGRPAAFSTATGWGPGPPVYDYRGRGTPSRRLGRIHPYVRSYHQYR